eukprot:753596-Hanusia_phi.AAC.5
MALRPPAPGAHHRRGDERRSALDSMRRKCHTWHDQGQHPARRQRPHHRRRRPLLDRLLLRSQRRLWLRWHGLPHGPQHVDCAAVRGLVLLVQLPGPECAQHPCPD